MSLPHDLVKTVQLYKPRSVGDLSHIKFKIKEIRSTLRLDFFLHSFYHFPPSLFNIFLNPAVELCPNHWHVSPLASVSQLSCNTAFHPARVGFALTPCFIGCGVGLCWLEATSNVMCVAKDPKSVEWCGALISSRTAFFQKSLSQYLSTAKQ